MSPEDPEPTPPGSAARVAARYLVNTRPVFFHRDSGRTVIFLPIYLAGRAPRAANPHFHEMLKNGAVLGSFQRTYAFDVQPFRNDSKKAVDTRTPGRRENRVQQWIMAPISSKRRNTRLAIKEVARWRHGRRGKGGLSDWWTW